MTMWLILFGSLFLLGGASLFFLIYSLGRLPFMEVLTNGSKIMTWLISAAIVIIPTGLIWMSYTVTNAIIVLLHFTFFWGLAEILRVLAMKFDLATISRSAAALVGVLVTVVYLGVGWYQAHHVAQTEYTVTTDKKVGNLRVAFFGDSHLGSTFDTDGLAEHLKTIEKAKPDLLVIAGDFVDERTTKAEMIKAAQALGDVNTPYGVYYVFGNHDKALYQPGIRDFSGDDLVAELEKNGVIVLQDESILLDDRFYLVGRQDASQEFDFGGSRASIADLMAPLDHSKYTIVLDHQPRDYAAEAKAGADLVLSGHTHGGQMIPLMQIIQWFGIGQNERLYGIEKRDNTNFIVTSGISDWAIQFKTGTKSEYVIVDVKEQ